MSSLSDLTTSTADPGVEAHYWRSSDDGAISCELCPRACRVIPGGLGFCAVRKNEGDRLISLSYGRPVALQVDPIEKKPLLEFLPGTKTFSIGAFGCNLDCSFCQNHHLSRGSYEEADIREFRGFTSPKEIVRMTKESGCESIAFTYNEPIVWCEYWADIAKLARSA
ncbi:MAG: hypothetical protein KAG97_09240, partial [Victivallales bacterium]|nr:hypothetical protein [Victivallales bacterium]